MNKIFDLDGPLMSVLNRIADLIWLNIITLVCCIPIVTIGPSITAMYYVTLKMVKGEESYIAKSFFKSFKENFKQGLAIGLIMTLIGGSIIGDFYLTYIGAFEMSQVIWFFMIVAVFIFVTVWIYVFPLLSRYYNPIYRTFINSLLVAVSNLPKTILLYLIGVFFIAAVYFVDWFVVIALLLGLSGPAFISSFFLRSIFDKQEEVMNNKKSESEMGVSDTEDSINKTEN